MSDLKPCPFCGNAPAREKDGEYHVICCSGCRAEVSSTSKRELDALWDRRAAALEGEPGEVDRLREAARKARAVLAQAVSAGWNAGGPTPEDTEAAFWSLDAALGEGGRDE